MQAPNGRRTSSVPSPASEKAFREDAGTETSADPRDTAVAPGRLALGVPLLRAGQGLTRRPCRVVTCGSSHRYGCACTDRLLGYARINTRRGSEYADAARAETLTTATTGKPNAGDRAVGVLPGKVRWSTGPSSARPPTPNFLKKVCADLPPGFPAKKLYVLTPLPPRRVLRQRHPGPRLMQRHWLAR